MAFSPGSNKNIILVNTSNASKTVVLPLLSQYPDRFLYIKDVTPSIIGGTYNPITIQTSNSDFFEDGTNNIQITSQFTNYTFYANPYRNCWNTLNYYDSSLQATKDIIPQFSNIIVGLSNVNDFLNQIISVLNVVGSLFTPQQTLNFVDTTFNIPFDPVNYPYYNITIPLQSTINNPYEVTTWSLTTTFNGLIASSGVSIATYINISNTNTYEDISGELFNMNTPYVWSMRPLSSGFPTRTTFTYTDRYNTLHPVSGNNVLANTANYSINMYVCIIDDDNVLGGPYQFLDGQFLVSLTPIQV
uniref:Uncharacterized protein n=1 Tax=viral metagenome TaxID=1070528 RepID=A0A6C0IA96_9ZZZZ